MSDITVTSQIIGLKFWSGTFSQLPETRDENTLYVVVDGTGGEVGTALYKGNTKIGLGSLEAPTVSVDNKVNVVNGTIGHIVTFVGGSAANNIQDSGKSFAQSVADDANTIPTNRAVKTYVDARIPEGLFHISGLNTTTLAVSAGFATCNGTLQLIYGGTISGTLATGYVVLKANTITNGIISNPTFEVEINMSNPTTANVYPLGHITVVNGTVTALSNYHPTTAIFMDVAQCSN